MTDLKFPESGIQSLLSALVDDKVYVLVAPDGAVAPYIVMQQIDDSDLARKINGPSGLFQCILQIDSYDGSDSLAAKRLGKKVEKILDGFRGVVYYGDDSPQEFVNIAGISLQNGSDLVDDTDTPRLFRRFALYNVTYRT